MRCSSSTGMKADHSTVVTRSRILHIPSVLVVRGIATQAPIFAVRNRLTFLWL
jgi:hypothetical protein